MKIYGPKSAGAWPASGIPISGSAFNYGSVAFASPLTLSFAVATLQSVILTGDITIQTSNLGGILCKEVEFINAGSSTPYALTFPAGWTWTTQKPTFLGTNSTGVLRLTCFGTTDANIVARWEESLSPSVIDYSRNISLADASANGTGYTASVSPQTLWALSALWKNLQANSIDSLMYSILIMAPDSLPAAITPMYFLKGGATCKNNGFVPADLTSAGLKGDGAAKYLDNYMYIPLDVASAGSYGLTLLVTQGSNSSSCDIGTFNGTGQLYVGFGGTAFFDCWNTTGGRISAANSLFTGVISAQRTSLTASAIYTHTTGGGFATLVSNTAESGIGTIPANGSISAHVGIFNASATNTTGVAGQFSDRRISCAVVSQGLNATQSQALAVALQACRKQLQGGFI